MLASGRIWDLCWWEGGCRGGARPLDSGGVSSRLVQPGCLAVLQIFLVPVRVWEGNNDNNQVIGFWRGYASSKLPVALYVMIDRTYGQNKTPTLRLHFLMLLLHCRNSLSGTVPTELGDLSSVSSPHGSPGIH